MRSIDVSEAIDQGRFSRFQCSVVIVCGLLLIVHGYDVFVAGTVLPTLIKEWGLSKPQAGILQAWALLGMMFGALVLGPLADRIGRRKGLAVSFLLFTVATLCTGFAASPDQLHASVAQLYTMSVSSTGLGWASGVGRVGAIVGPTRGGVVFAISTQRALTAPQLVVADSVP